MSYVCRQKYPLQYLLWLHGHNCIYNYITISGTLIISVFYIFHISYKSSEFYMYNVYKHPFNVFSDYTGRMEFNWELQTLTADVIQRFYKATR